MLDRADCHAQSVYAMRCHNWMKVLPYSTGYKGNGNNTPTYDC